MKIFISLLLCLTSVSSIAAESRNRIEELFLWKMSEDLKLTVSEEKSFSELIRSLNSRKSKFNETIQVHLKNMSQSKAVKEKQTLIKGYRKVLSEYNQLQLEEVDKILKLFGTDKAAQYFVLKNDISNRLKGMLANPENKTEEKKPKPLPKLIEE